MNDFVYQGLHGMCYALAYLLEAWISWLYTERLLPRKSTRVVLSASFAGGYLVLCLLSLLQITAVTAAAFFALNTGLLLLNYRCSARAAILHSAYLSFIMTLPDILGSLLLALSSQASAIYATRDTYTFSTEFALQIGSRLLYLLLAMLGARVLSRQGTGQESRLMASLCCIPLFSVMMGMGIIWLSTHNTSVHTAALLSTINVFALLLANLLFLVVYGYLQKAGQEHLETQLTLQQGAAEAAYYLALQEQFDQQRILIHDIKNHLHTIESLADAGQDAQVVEYITKLESSLLPPQQAKMCSDPVMNAILLRFSKNCMEHDVQFLCDVRDGASGHMDAPGVTTLYGNLLSNALEAASVSQNRSIELSVTKQHDALLVSVVNSCDVPPVPDGGSGFLTRKADPQHHGVGLRSIARIVKQYNGLETMYYDAGTKQFHHIIRFPLEQ